PDPDDDGDPSNNQGPTPVDITALSDLAIAKTGSTGSEPGETTWLLTVTNTGPAPAPGPITVVDSAGQGLTITSAVGNGWTCTNTSSSATCTDADGLAVGMTSVITIEATSEPDISVTNSATVSFEADNDPNPANDSDELSLVVGGLPFTGLTLSRTALLAFLLVLTGTALIGVGARRKTEHK
ncbi:MAG: DUF11 domain-containing protein, partial [Acidimicrobiia bacterium]